MYKVSIFCIWRKRLFLVEKYFCELMWIYDVDIEIVGSGIKVSGVDEDVNGCLCCIEGLLIGFKNGGENEKRF